MKCSDIPDTVFCHALARTTAWSDPRFAELPTEGPGALIRAEMTRIAVAAGGWRPRTPFRNPGRVLASLEDLMGAPVPPKVFYAKARRLEERGILNAYGRSWHLARECLDFGCCPGAPLTRPEPYAPVSVEEIALMERIFAEHAERERAAPHPPMQPYDLASPAKMNRPSSPARRSR